MKKYTSYSYVKKLERCLRKLPYEERLDAVTYYSEYLADAGPEREREVIERLGPPQRVASEIRADAALRELNSKTWLVEKAREERRMKKERRRAAAAGVGANANADANADAGGSYADEVSRDDLSYRVDGGTDTAEGENAPRGPNMGESFSAAGLGAMSMLSMPVARPFAVLACVLGIIGLVLGVIVVVALFAAAGAVAVCGAASFVIAFMVFPQDPSVTLFFAGAGMMLAGSGLVIGILNYLLGRAIFKGIANLSGRIRHKRVKVRREAFDYTYTYEREDSSAASPQSADPYAYENPYAASPQSAGPFTPGQNANPYTDPEERPQTDR